MQAQYRNLPQAMQRSPANRPRPGIGTVPQKGDAPMPAQTAQKAQEEQARRRELAKRRSDRPSDRNMPDGLENIVIGDGVQRYNSLREVEKKLDAVVTRKRLDLQDSVMNHGKEHRTVRIWISNTAENQPWQPGIDPDAFDFSSGSEATYRVKIEGRLLPEEGEAVPDAPVNDPQNLDAMKVDSQEDSSKLILSALNPRRRFSHFFKSITIDFDRSSDLQPDGFNQIEWRKPENRTRFPDVSPQADFDCLEFERKSDENINIVINLERDEMPERYRLSPALAELLDRDESDRTEIIMGIWDYIRAMNLQEDEDSRRIHCDDRLKAVFNSDALHFSEVPNLIRHHLTPLPPIQLRYTIRVDQAFHELAQSSAPSATPTTTPSAPAPKQSPKYTIYDIRVSIDSPLRAPVHSFLHAPTTLTTLKSLAASDDALALLVQAIAQSKARHAFFTSMATDPATFLRRWTSSQKRDLEVILGEGARGGGEDGGAEEFRRGGRGGVWGAKAARESVGLFLARQSF